jgi:hypothetical protein
LNSWGSEITLKLLVCILLELGFRLAALSIELLILFGGSGESSVSFYFFENVEALLGCSCISSFGLLNGVVI